MCCSRATSDHPKSVRSKLLSRSKTEKASCNSWHRSFSGLGIICFKTSEKHLTKVLILLILLIDSSCDFLHGIHVMQFRCHQLQEPQEKFASLKPNPSENHLGLVCFLRRHKRACRTGTSM